jgi:agmatine deiminase
MKAKKAPAPRPVVKAIAHPKASPKAGAAPVSAATKPKGGSKPVKVELKQGKKATTQGAGAKAAAGKPIAPKASAGKSVAAKPAAAKQATAKGANPKPAPASAKIKSGEKQSSAKPSAAPAGKPASASGGKPASAPVSSSKPVKPAKKGPWFEVSAKTPKQAKFRMPAEWETHYGTFLTWPNKKGISFPGKGAYEAALPAFESMLHALIASEQVFINVASEEDKQAIRDVLTIAEQSRVHFLDTPSMEPWCRDHGATFVVRAEDRGGGSVVWKFNSWGQKYDKANVDAVISRRMAEYLGGKVFEPGMVMEGGAIDVNGSGTVLTTESCLLNKNRNKGVKKEDMERLLKDFLGVTNVLWLPGGVEGDDTDGHIDTITRFVNRTTVVTCVEENPKDKNHAVLAKNLALLKGMKLEDGTDLQVVPLPMPQPIVRKGQRLPATYANFYIGNKVVLLPQYDDPADEKALEIMVKSFPTRRIYPIDCRELIWGLGAFHCLTQQVPLAAFPKVVELIRNPPPAPRPVY